MVTANRTPPDALTDLVERARPYELFQALRLIDAAHGELPPLGEAAGPHDEAVRIGIDPGLDFAAADSMAHPPGEGERGQFVRLDARGFGLLGPNGPLPLHVTEQIRAALLHERDAAPLHFMEMLQHRLISLFYRAYGQARAAIQADRPQTDHFALYLGALFGRHAAAADRGAFRDASRLYFTGRYAAATRSAEALEAIVQHEFNVKANVTPFSLGWLILNAANQSALGRSGDASSLGRAAIAGARIQDRQCHIHLQLGPMPLDTFLRLLPTGEDFACLAALVEEFTRGELFCRVQLVLRRREVPATVLGREGRLGYVSWLGSPTTGTDAGDAEFSLC